MLNFSEKQIQRNNAKLFAKFLQPGELNVHNEPEPKPDIPTEEEFLAFIRVRKWLGI
jgi:hypothetical protein